MKLASEMSNEDLVFERFELEKEIREWMRADIKVLQNRVANLEEAVSRLTACVDMGEDETS